MKKLLSFLLILCLLGSLIACGGRETAPESTAEPVPTPAPTAEPVPEPTPEPTPEPVAAQEPAWVGIYRECLRSRGGELTAACGFVSGAGLIDLDLDRQPELLLFDAGAASSMGVQFFDIVNGAVECVSASSLEVGPLLGGEHFDPALYVNTVDFSAFRLVEDRSGALYFTVKSYNGSEELRYSEHIRFLNRDGILGLETLLCRQSAYDPETQELLYTVCTVGDSPISEEDYNARLAELESVTDLGYEARGRFVWEDGGYTLDAEGLLRLYEDAVALYVPAI